MVNNKMSAINRYLLGKGASEELLQIMTQNVFKRVVQALPPQNRGQVAAQEQFSVMREALGMSNAWSLF